MECIQRCSLANHGNPKRRLPGGRRGAHPDQQRHHRMLGQHRGSGDLRTFTEDRDAAQGGSGIWDVRVCILRRKYSCVIGTPQRAGAWTVALEGSAKIRSEVTRVDRSPVLGYCGRGEFCPFGPASIQLHGLEARVQVCQELSQARHSTCRDRALTSYAVDFGKEGQHLGNSSRALKSHGPA